MIFGNFRFNYYVYVMTKKCFKCKVEKGVSEFYKHNKMKDGYLNKCKECTKNDNSLNYKKKSLNEEWVESERKRGRDKYKRLGYASYSKERNIRVPSTNLAAYKSLSKKLKIETGKEAHHWSYKIDHVYDVIILDIKTHRRLHRLMTLDHTNMWYISKYGDILDSKDKHVDFIKKHFSECDFTLVNMNNT